MADDLTTTIFSTTTLTSTRTLTRTILSLTPTPSSPANGILLDSTNPENHTSLYTYSPSLALAIIFTIFYFFATIHHGYLSIYLPIRPETLDKHRYTIPLFIASLFSTIGYLLRSISITSHYTSNLALYSTSTTFILASPLPLCATLYLLLARLITRCLPPITVPTPTTPQHLTASSKPQSRTNPQRFLLLPPTLLPTLFLTSLTISALLLFAGIILHNHQSQAILLTSHTLTLTTHLTYLVTLHLFCQRVRNTATTGFNPLIMKVVIATWMASGFLMLPLAYHLTSAAVAVYGQHHTPTVEWPLYIFDAVPILAALVVLGWWHPVRWIQERVLNQVQPRPKVVEFELNKPGAELDGSNGKFQYQGNHVAADQDKGTRQHVRKRSQVGFAFAF